MQYATKRGCIAVKLQGSAVGTPDRLFLLPGGITMIVEFKTLTGRLAPRQTLVFPQYARDGHPVLSLRQTKTFKIVLDSMLKHGVD